MSTFVLPVAALRTFTNGDFESAVQTAVPGQYGWLPVVLPGGYANGYGTVAANGFLGPQPIQGGRSAYVRCYSPFWGEAQREVRFVSPLASYPFPDAANVVRFSYRAYFNRGYSNPNNEARWRVRGKVVHLDGNLVPIGESAPIAWEGSQGPGVPPGIPSDSGVVTRTIPVGDIGSSVRYLRAEFELLARVVSIDDLTETWVEIDRVELQDIDLVRSENYSRYVASPINGANFVGGCPANGNPVAHPGGITDASHAGDYWIEVFLKDSAGAPVPDVSDVKLNFSACQHREPYHHYNIPLAAFADAPTDANAVTGGSRFRLTSPPPRGRMRTGWVPGR